jgi:hypothetical protein
VNTSTAISQRPSGSRNLALSRTSASPMHAIQLTIVSVETRTSRSHIGRGTLNFLPRASANNAGAAAQRRRIGRARTVVAPLDQ